MKTRRLFSMIAASLLLCGYSAAQTKRTPQPFPTYQPPPATPIADCSPLGPGCDSFNQLVRAGDREVLVALDTANAAPGNFTYVCFPQIPEAEELWNSQSHSDGLDYFEIIGFSQIAGERKVPFFYYYYTDGQLENSLVQMLEKDKTLSPSVWNISKPWKGGQTKQPQDDWLQVFLDSDGVSLNFQYHNTSKELVRVSENIRRSTLRVSESHTVYKWNMRLSGQCVSYPLQTKQDDGNQQK